jgi:serine/threonine protein kinase
MMSNMLQYHHHYCQEEFRHPQHWYCHEAIQTKVDSISRGSAFLSTTPQTDIPCFDRCEVEVGPHVLGQGAFSQVHSVARLHLKPGGQTSVKSSVHCRKQSLAEQIAGQGRSHYAMKHLREDLVGNKEDFESAAIDLCIEVKFLTRLNHPNIVKVRGLANGWTGAFADRHDGFFIIMDRMEPLDHRIQRWRDRLYRCPERGQVSLARKIDYASQIADAISYLHDRRIIFR